VKDGEVVGEGLNHVGAKCDPTSHGEIEAIRDACAKLGTTDLSGCTMYASCEPCAMCVMAMYRAGIGRLVYGMSLTQSLELLPPPVDTAAVLREAVKPVAERSMPATQMMAEEACEAVAEWSKRSEQG
jgi:tRNA(Arg) A34 adenosine deaminase TadA